MNRLALFCVFAIRNHEGAFEPKHSWFLSLLPDRSISPKWLLKPWYAIV